MQKEKLLKNILFNHLNDIEGIEIDINFNAKESIYLVSMKYNSTNMLLKICKGMAMANISTDYKVDDNSVTFKIPMCLVVKTFSIVDYEEEIEKGLERFGEIMTEDLNKLFGAGLDFETFIDGHLYDFENSKSLRSIIKLTRVKGVGEDIKDNIDKYLKDKFGKDNIGLAVFEEKHYEDSSFEFYNNTIGESITAINNKYPHNDELTVIYYDDNELFVMISDELFDIVYKAILESKGEE